MRYLWEVVLQAQKEKKPPKSVYYTHASGASPYMEISLKCLNQDDFGGDDTVEVNTYYRFYSIFKDIYKPQPQEFIQIRKSLTNLIIHTLAGNDVRQGMTMEEYYKKMLISDIEKGVCGDLIKQVFSRLDRDGQDILLGGWLRSYQVGSSLSIFIDMVHSLIENSIVYHNNDCPDEILIYTSMCHTSKTEQKIRCLIEIFLDIRYHVEIFYEYHFGIIGIEDTMMVDEIAIY